MGRAEDLFLRIKKRGADEILRMVREKITEELFLDYKRSATDDTFAKLHRDDLKNFGKPIAGFANSEGGVIVWGVDCRRDPPNGDVPTGPKCLLAIRQPLRACWTATSALLLFRPIRASRTSH